MSNPRRLTDEQLEAYGKQIAEERAIRSALPKGLDIQSFIDWLKQDGIRADQIKFGDPHLIGLRPAPKE